MEPISASKSTFQSTPSARRATVNTTTRNITGKYFNPRPPRGERRFVRVKQGVEVQISIHALREEGDRTAPEVDAAARDFNPRPPRGGRPTSSALSAADCCISIHALREESDRISGRWAIPRQHISIHALREESDPQHAADGGQVVPDFNPRPPRGERR